MTTIRKALEATSAFLSASVETDTGLSLISRLHGSIPPSSMPSSTSELVQVIMYGAHILKGIDDVVVSENAQLGIKDWRLVNALVEIILVLGLYKAWTP